MLILTGDDEAHRTLAQIVAPEISSVTATPVAAVALCTVLEGEWLFRCTIVQSPIVVQIDLSRTGKNCIQKINILQVRPFAEDEPQVQWPIGRWSSGRF